MGMYTEIRYFGGLKKDVPEHVPHILRFMVGQPVTEPSNLPDHPLFKDTRWAYMLNCDSYYFEADTHSTMRFDDIGEQWQLTVQSNLKNYNDEIAKFIDWVSPYVQAMDGQFVGYTRYEEENNPTLIYHNRGLVAVGGQL